MFEQNYRTAKKSVFLSFFPILFPSSSSFSSSPLYRLVSSRLATFNLHRSCTFKDLSVYRYITKSISDIVTPSDPSTLQCVDTYIPLSLIIFSHGTAERQATAHSHVTLHRILSTTALQLSSGIPNCKRPRTFYHSSRQNRLICVPLKDLSD